MRILLLHPEDNPLRGPWAAQPWNAVFDLGFAGAESYRRWSESLGCRVQPAQKLNDAGFDQVRDSLSGGSGILVDQHGLDWWDLIALEFHPQMEETARLRPLAARIARNDEVFISRAGFHANVLESLIQRPLHRLSSHDGLGWKLRRYARAASRLSSSQLLQILSDKYDTGYRLRRLLIRKPNPSGRPVVLLPSAYVNVSRAEAEYAGMLPETDFLLVATRQSGWMAKAPENVRQEKLASYASSDKSRKEFEHLLALWERLRQGLRHNSNLSELLRCGALDAFPRFLRDGLAIRDAWLHVFEREPVESVLCADDANLPTRIPLLIAKNRGLPAIACHHGALDGRYRFRPGQEFTLIAKGAMQRDYLENICGVSACSIEIGAPMREEAARLSPTPEAVVFFSEPYEVLGGRTAEFYRDVLPSLADLAVAHQRALVIKLHPAESLSERRALAKAVLSDQQFKRACFVAGPLTDELLGKTWFAVTVISTTAVDCSIRGIPVFLCPWLDYSNYRYSEQFLKFGSGVRLNGPQEISALPSKLKNWAPPKSSALAQPIRPERLAELLHGQKISKVAAAS